MLTDGVFYAAHELYGLTFKERTDLPVYQADVRVFEVFDQDGKPLALFLGDYYARDNKAGGAWMNSYVKQSKLFDLKPVTANHLNIPKPAAGQPTLLTFDEVRTLFHEFETCDPRHAVGTCAIRCSRVRACRATSSSIRRSTTRCGRTSLRCSRTTRGTTRPARRCRRISLNKVLAAQKFDQGYATTEYLAAALLDQAWHTIGGAEAPVAKDVASFESGRAEEGRHRLRGRAARVITRPTSRTSSPAGTRGATTRIYGAKCLPVTPVHGCSRTAVSRARTAIGCGRRCYRGGGRKTRRNCSKTSTVADLNIGPLLEYRGLTEAKHWKV